MRVGINNLPLKSGHESRGIGNYTRNLISGLKELGVEVVEFGDLNKLETVDVVHYPFFDLGFASLPFRKRFPSVVTIHDVTPLVFSKHYPMGIRGRINFARQKLSLKGVKAVVTDSACSKKDIHEYLGLKNDKIFTVYLAAGDGFRIIKDLKQLENIRHKYNLPERFALYVGDINWNKNLVGVAQAARQAEIDLVCVGKNFENRQNLNHPETQSFKQFLDEFGDDIRTHIIGFLPDDELATVYNLARVVLLPSFYEGFGLTILEAQKSGVPVITSNIGSMIEVAGDGVLLVDPRVKLEIVNAIKELDSDKQLREKLIKKGLENVKRFDWVKTAKQTLEVYKYALKAD